MKTNILLISFCYQCRRAMPMNTIWFARATIVSLALFMLSVLWHILSEPWGLCAAVSLWCMVFFFITTCTLVFMLWFPVDNSKESETIFAGIIPVRYASDPVLAIDYWLLAVSFALIVSGLALGFLSLLMAQNTMLHEQVVFQLGNYMFYAGAGCYMLWCAISALSSYVLEGEKRPLAL